MKKFFLLTKNHYYCMKLKIIDYFQIFYNKINIFLDEFFINSWEKKISLIFFLSFSLYFSLNIFINLIKSFFIFFKKKKRNKLIKIIENEISTNNEENFVFFLEANEKDELTFKSNLVSNKDKKKKNLIKNFIIDLRTTTTTRYNLEGIIKKLKELKICNQYKTEILKNENEIKDFLSNFFKKLKEVKKKQFKIAKKEIRENLFNFFKNHFYYNFYYKEITEEKFQFTKKKFMIFILYNFFIFIFFLFISNKILNYFNFQ